MILARETLLNKIPHGAKMAPPGKFRKRRFSKMAPGKMMTFRKMDISAVCRSRTLISTPKDMFTRSYVHNVSI